MGRYGTIVTPQYTTDLIKMMLRVFTALLLCPLSGAFSVGGLSSSRCRSVTTVLFETIESPFDQGESTPKSTEKPMLDLTWDNVESVLEEMRPYLIQDGGNVAISEIDGPVVKLELQVRILD